MCSRVGYYKFSTVKRTLPLTIQNETQITTYFTQFSVYYLAHIIKIFYNDTAVTTNERNIRYHIFCTMLRPLHISAKIYSASLQNLYNEAFVTTNERPLLYISQNVTHVTTYLQKCTVRFYKFSPMKRSLPSTSQNETYIHTM